MRQQVSVVIPVLDAGRTIRDCVASVRRALDLWGPGEIVAVDGGSEDDTLEILHDFAQKGVRLVGGHDLTVGESRNLGVSASEGGLLAFVDADCVVSEDFLVRAAASLEENDAAAVGSPYALPPQPARLERVWAELHPPGSDGPTRWLYGGNLVIRREAFEAVGGFQPGLPSGEDIDLCHRLIARGYRIVQDRGVRVVHLGNPGTLGDFFRQQRWHAAGMLASARGLDRPLVMTLVHVGLSGASLAAAAAAGSLPTALLAVLAGQLMVPLATIGYRVRKSAGWPWRDVPIALVLYWLYYWARAISLLPALRPRHRIRGISPPGGTGA